MRDEIAALTCAVEAALLRRTASEAGALIDALWLTVAPQLPSEESAPLGEAPEMTQTSCANRCSG